MPSFFGTEYTNERLARLQLRILAIVQLFADKKIKVSDFTTLANLNADQCNELTGRLLRAESSSRLIRPETESAFNQLYFALASAEHADIHANPDENFMQALKDFDNAHEDHLSLNSLALTDPNSIALHIQAFALFYFLFIQNLSITEENEHSFHLKLNIESHYEVLSLWTEARKEIKPFNPMDAGLPGVFEKFINGSLKSSEWLTDNDLERAVRIYGLGYLNVHTVTMSSLNLGQVLHQERNNHAFDQPVKPYVVPFILNLGSNQLNQRGSHWVRMLITVDPTKAPTKINVQYTDEMTGSRTSALNLKRIIARGIAFNQPPVCAFPDAEIDFNIHSTGEQRDGYSCGYRALRGLIQDLAMAGVIEPDRLQQKLLKCETSRGMRDALSHALVYRYALPEDKLTLLRDAGIPMIEKEEGKFYLAPPAHGEEYPFSTALHQTRNKRIQSMSASSSLTDKSDAYVLLPSASVLETLKVTPAKNTELSMISLSDELSIPLTPKTEKLLKTFNAMGQELENIPKSHPEHQRLRKLLTTLNRHLNELVQSKSPLVQEQEVKNCIKSINETVPHLGQYQSWRSLFRNFFSALLECIPVLLGGGQIRSGLTEMGYYKADRRPVISRLTSDLKTIIEQFQDLEPAQEHQLHLQ